MDLVAPSRINPFKKLIRANQAARPVFATRAGAEPGGVDLSFLPYFADTGFDLVSEPPLWGAEELSSAGDLNGTCAATGVYSRPGSLNTTMPSGPRKSGSAPVNSRRARIVLPLVVSGGDRMMLISSATDSIKAISEYYGIAESDQDTEVRLLSSLNDADLASAAKGFEFSAETVEVLLSEKGARAVLSLDHVELRDFLVHNVITEEQLEPPERVTVGGGSPSQRQYKGL